MLAEDLLALAERLAAEAADLLVAGLGEARALVATKSTPTDMVTEMDQAAERLVRDGIRAARPDDAILGEEGTADVGSSGVRWLIDPIDGTTNYLYGLPGFSVSVAAQVDGVTEAGVVVDPLHRETFTAVRGAGAFRNGQAIAASSKDDLATALVGTGFSYDAGRRAAQAKVLTSVLPRVRDLRRLGAASVDLCWVGCGRFDGYWERGLSPWDYAAGALVAAEAGATVGDLDGGPPSTAFALAASPGLFGALRDLLAGAGAGSA